MLAEGMGLMTLAAFKTFQDARANNFDRFYKDHEDLSLDFKTRLRYLQLQYGRSLRMHSKISTGKWRAEMFQVERELEKMRKS